MTEDGRSTQTTILPFVEAIFLALKIDFFGGYKGFKIRVDGVDRPIASYRVPTYLCPSIVMFLLSARSGVT